MTAILEVAHVSASYGPYRALDDVSFTLDRGAVLGVLGANGAGKTTLSRVLAGLVPATAGSVVVDGVDVDGRRPSAIVRCGLVHVNEGRAVFASLTVEENLRFVGGLHGRAAVRRAMADAYEAFPALGAARRRAAGTLSGGEQRQLALMKALALRPSILVVDELSLGLSPSASAHLYERLADERDRGLAMVVVESQTDHLAALADRAIVVDHGRVRFDGGVLDALADLRRSVSDVAGR